MCGSMVDTRSATAENRRGKKKKKEETAATEYNGLSITIYVWAAIIRPEFATVNAKQQLVNLRPVKMLLEWSGRPRVRAF